MYLIGPGTALHELLAAYGLEPDEVCECEFHARQMDFWGPDGCQARLPEITGWLEAEAKRRGLWFSGLLAKQLVKLAIRRSRQTALTAAGVTLDTPPWLIEPLLEGLTAEQRLYPNAVEAAAIRAYKQGLKVQLAG